MYSNNDFRYYSENHLEHANKYGPIINGKNSSEYNHNYYLANLWRWGVEKATDAANAAKNKINEAIDNSETKADDEAREALRSLRAGNRTDAKNHLKNATGVAKNNLKNQAGVVKNTAQNYAGLAKNRAESAYGSAKTAVKNAPGNAYNAAKSAANTASSAAKNRVNQAIRNSKTQVDDQLKAAYQYAKAGNTSAAKNSLKNAGGVARNELKNQAGVVKNTVQNYTGLAKNRAGSVYDSAKTRADQLRSDARYDLTTAARNARVSADLAGRNLKRNVNSALDKTMADEFARDAVKSLKRGDIRNAGNFAGQTLKGLEKILAEVLHQWLIVLKMQLIDVSTILTLLLTITQEAR